MKYINDYELCAGLEVHVELKTKTKIFCSCKTDFGAEPNTQVCPVCLGHPGTLPTLNERAVEYALRAGLCLNCRISEVSGFDRKNYFYPDLPKAYQISQYEKPICEGGFLSIETENGEKKIGITRIHMEEDAGKLLHTKDRGTLIDYNRAGVPLIEIVSEPDIRSPEEAVAYLRELRSILLYAGVSDCKMNEGSLRCDVNLSVRKKGSAEMGTRCELKNLNSFKFIEKAMEYEYRRQIEVLEGGGGIVQETRRFDESSGKTFSMRKKEKQSDYRFFPEPDLLRVEISEKMIAEVRSSLPVLPKERREKYCESYGIPISDGVILTQDRKIADWFEKAAPLTRYPKTCANMILSEIMAFDESESLPERILPENMASLCDMAGDGTINSAVAKKLIRRMWESDIDPEKVVADEGLAQIRDRETIRTFVKAAIETMPKAVDDYKKGKETASRSIVGKAMGLSSGKAAPDIVALLVEEELLKI